MLSELWPLVLHIESVHSHSRWMPVPMMTTIYPQHRDMASYIMSRITFLHPTPMQSRGMMVLMQQPIQRELRCSLYLLIFLPLLELRFPTSLAFYDIGTSPMRDIHLQKLENLCHQTEGSAPVSPTLLSILEAAKLNTLT